MGVSHRTNKPVNNPERSSIREHSIKTKHLIKLSNFSILQSFNSSLSDLHILESLYIHKNKPTLNDYQSAVKLNIA